LLDAGMTFTAMTQARAEDLIRDLVRAGEVQAEQAQSVIDELLDRSRRNSERLIDAVRAEIRQQMASLGLATKNDVERLERRIAEVSAARGTRKATTKKASTRRSTKATREAGGRASTAKKAPAKKAPAKKATARKAPARKATARKVPAKRAGGAKTGTRQSARKATKSSRSSSASKATRARSTR
jgi:polyhydroxyalkanoate synthesis regulator phasin